MLFAMQQNDDDQPATKADIRQLRAEIDGVTINTATIISDALQLISERFDKQDKKFEQVFGILNRIENKLDATAERVDDHEVRIGRLEHERA